LSAAEGLILEFWPHFDTYLRGLFRRQRYPEHLRDDARSLAMLRLWQSALRYVAKSPETTPWPVYAKVAIKYALRRTRRLALRGWVVPDSGAVLGASGVPYQRQLGIPEFVTSHDPHPHIDARLDVRRAVAELPPRYRHVVSRYHFDGWTFAEIAEEQNGVTRQCTHQMLRRAHGWMRERVQKECCHTPALSLTQRGRRAKLDARHRRVKPVQPGASRGARLVAMASRSV
jgi:DNA-directed RNA polymerase specialized sigma24 family protein